MSNKFATFLVMALILSGVSCKPAGHSGKEYSAVKCDVSSLPDVQSFVADLFRSRIEERTPSSGCAATLKVKFLFDPSLDGERAEINVRRGKAVVRGARFRSLVAGAGELLRAISYGEQAFCLPDTVLTFAPAKPFRQVYFGRHFDNWYHRAPAEKMLRYIDDMALWGMNAVHTILNYPAVDAAHSTDADKVAFAAVSNALASRVRALDMDLTVSGGGNIAPSDMPEEFRATLNTDWRRGGNEWCVCPEIPGAMDYLLGVKKDHISQLAGLPISGIEFWPYDEGGCGCPLCSPWGGRGYVKLIERYRHLFDDAFPGCLKLVSTWCFDDADWERFYEFLRNQDWVDYIVADSHGEFPKYPLNHPLPEGVRLITFPEISMWGRYPWGSFGAIATPARFERLFRQAESISSGCQLYSEGLFEDLNKFVVNGLYKNPSMHADDLLREYARYEFPGCNEEDFVAFVHILEETHETYVEGTENDYFVKSYIVNGPSGELSRRQKVCAENLALAEKMESEMLPAMRLSWRWRVLKLRAVIDNQLYSTRQVHNAVLDDAYRELVDIYCAEEQMKGVAKGYGGHTCPPILEEYLNEKNN